MVRTLAGVALGAAGLLHAGPSVLIVPSVSRRVAPAVAGIGRSDHIALTFDDGPDPATTPDFLDALERHGWHATFFLLGSMVEQAPGLAADIAAAGHEVAVHGWHHRSHLLRLPTDVAADVQRAADTIAEATGATPRWFRPPYGHLTSSTLLACRIRGLRPVLWTATGKEWCGGATPNRVADVLRRSLHGGDTVLLHDSDCTSPPGSARAALGALEELAPEFKSRGWQPGPLAEHVLDGACADRDDVASPQDIGSNLTNNFIAAKTTGGIR